MIVSCAEALVDFTPAVCGTEAGYVPRPGGSPFNVAVALARLGTPTCYLGRLSTDFFGDLLAETLVANAVDMRFVRRTPEPSTLAFVKLAAGAEPQYAFFNAGAADRMLSPEDLPSTLGPEVEALHVGSFALAIEPVATALETLLMREHGRRVLSLDPNVRPTMVGERGLYRGRLERLIRLVDVVKVSEADIAWLHPGASIADIAVGWLALGPRLVAVTEGADGAVAYRASGDVRVPAEPVRVIDTVGAGDSFTAGLLAALREKGALSAPGLDALSVVGLHGCLKFANRVAGLTCSRAGANPPLRSELVG